MGFKFTYLCDLLSKLEDNRTIKASTAAKNSNPDIRAVSRWFTQHERRIHGRDTCRLALLSCLFPEKRTDRVYWLQDTSLARVIGRCLLLGSSRRAELDRWRVFGGGDLGQCVENVMRQAENQIPEGQEVTVEEIDEALNRIASRCRFSGPRVRRQHTAVDVEAALGPLYRRLSSRDAKWLTRMILKSYVSVVLPASFVLRRFHFLLPHLLLFQDSFHAALGMLHSEPMVHFPPCPEPGLAKDLAVVALSHLTPQVGVKIGRPDFYKARSLKHCSQMAERRRMSLERKYDGEYCQIHVDLTKSDFIQIFSKSGKDSTVDRSGVHEALKDALRIGRADCKFSRHCILEGELLVWSDKEQKILEFHKLRKFIPRSGSFIGVENDSLPQHGEHLMLVFYDILLLDDIVCLRKPHRERRLLLKDVVQATTGRAGLAEQEILDFSRSDCQYRLEKAFSKSMALRWEGYVLKACDEPYFTILSTNNNPYYGRWIKLKKDYIPGLGDMVDFAIIGARYESRAALKLKEIRKSLYTHFYIGCLLNAEAVAQVNAKPQFRVVDVIDQTSMNLQIMQYLNQMGEFYARNPSSHYFEVDMEHGQTSIPPMEVMFKTPFIAEMRGFGFDKPKGASYFTLRFPQVLKIHTDRSFVDAVSFSDLQAIAKEARSVDVEEQSQEMERCAKRLKLANASSSVTGRGSSSFGSADGSSFQSVSSDVASDEAADVSLSGSVEQSGRSFAVAESEDLPEKQDGDATVNAYLKDSYTNPLETEKSNTNEIQAPSLPTLTRQPNTPIISPLTSIPLLTTTTTPSATNTIPKNPNTTQTLNNFLNLLRSPTTRTHQKLSNPHASSKDIALGIILLHPHDLPTLSTRLYDVSRCLSKAVRRSVNQPEPKTNDNININENDNENNENENENENDNSENPPPFPQKGKIFFLNHDILNLGDGPHDTRFCLKQTWENIGRASYFYASVMWEGDVDMKMEESCRTRTQSQNQRQGQGQGRGCDGRVPCRVTVGFDRRELGVLGEFGSVWPVVRVFGDGCSS